MLCCCLLGLGCSRGSATPDDEGSSTVQGGSTGVAGAGASAGAGAGGQESQAGGASAGAAGLPLLDNDTSSGAFVHLFEWRWTDIARECETFLGPKGFTAVQVSPASEHAVLKGNYYPWWQRYQTVSYALESRSGTRAEFADMVARCRAAGVGISVDAVLNHMTGQASGIGSAGTKFTKYAYPGLFEPADFHMPACQIQGADYASSAEHVQNCELVGLSDLDTASVSVQDKLAAYLSDLLSLGVRGFRIDAAKHMSAADLAAILAKVTPRAGEAPYYFLEVIDYGGEAVQSSDYLDAGGDAELDVTEFRYKLVADAFLGRGGKTLASLASLTDATDTFLAGERAVVFLDNHDTQRADALFYQDGPAHDLATVFMLAWPYGYPSIMSSFGFDRSSAAGRDAGPPSDAQGNTTAAYPEGSDAPSCAAAPFGPESRGFVCEHRQRYAANMVGFRKATAGAALTAFWSNEGNQIAFSRDGRGFVAINHDVENLTQSLATGLPGGRYCDVLSGDYLPPRRNVIASCDGAIVEVDASGSVELDLPPESALALHVGARL